MLRELIESLFKRRSISAEDVVFEPLDDSSPNPSSSASAVGEGLGRSVPLEKLWERVPAKWRQPGPPPANEVLVLSPEALLAGGDLARSRYSLRYLARFYPSTFRDPGVMEADPGVVLPEEDLRDPVAGLRDPVTGLSALPPETVSEAAGDPVTFSEWEGEPSGGAERAEEKRETQKVLRGVRLPKADFSIAEGFDVALSRSAARDEAAESRKSGAEPGAFANSGAGTSDAKPTAAVPNQRLRRILAAYAETLPELAGAREAAATGGSAGGGPLSRPAAEPAGQMAVRLPELEGGRGQTAPSPEQTPSGFKGTVPGQASVQVPLKRGAAPGGAGEVEARGGRGEGVGGGEGVGAGSRGGEGFESSESWEKRLGELGKSLARFSQVKGYVLWEGSEAGQSGDLGFDPRQAGVRDELERMLRSGARFGGGGDAFFSLTFQSASGGLAVFGGGECVVAVAYRGSEGISEGLRGWLCGWVAQSGGRGG